MTPEDLEHLLPLLTPSLLTLLADTIIPHPSSRSHSIDFAHVGRTFFTGGGQPLPTTLQTQAWAVLVALSKLGPDNPNIPDGVVDVLLTRVLPPPADPEFPRLALGMQILLDQMPRRLCRGLDQRWTNAFFDRVSLGFARALDELDGKGEGQGEGVYSWERWRDGVGVSLGYWVLVRTWFVCPFVHTDDRKVQERAVRFTEETRTVVERGTGTRDPNRDAEVRNNVLEDVYGFPRMVREAYPDAEGEDRSVQTFAYWMCRLMDVHVPVVRRFGRYPYRNAFFGREDTAEEEEWFRETGDFARPSGEVRERLRRDIEEGVWTPLGEA